MLNKQLIGSRIKELRTLKGLSQEAFGQSIGVTRSALSQIEGGTVLPSLELLNKIIEAFSIPYEWLIGSSNSMHGNMHGSMHGLPDKQFETPQKSMSGLVSGSMSGLPYKQYETAQKISYVSEDGNTYYIEPKEARLVPITDMRAAAGAGEINEAEISQYEVMSLPTNFLKSGHTLAVRIKGDSMAPTLQDGGYMVIRLIERGEWATMPEGHIYVISDTEGKTFIKRVKNRLSKGFIVCTSDNPDKASNPSFNLQMEEINTLWHAEWYLSAKMPNVHDQFYTKLSTLEDTVDQLSQEISGIKRLLNAKKQDK